MTRFDRRALFASGTAAALLAAAGVSAAGVPQRGGHLRAALSGGDRDASFLHVPGGHFLRAARMAVFETLTEIAPDGTLQPGLAMSWVSTEGGRVWQFTLRNDVPFHSERMMQAEDVVASLRVHGFTADAEDQTVRLSLNTADPGLPFRLATEGYVIFAADDLALGAPTNGTGLYRIRHMSHGRSFIADRVGKHRKDGIAGWFDTVEFVAVADMDTRAEAVRDGHVDVADIQDGTMAARAPQIQSPSRCGCAPLDDMRFAERWWMTTA